MKDPVIESRGDDVSPLPTLPPVSPIFRSPIPSLIVFSLGVLLFFMPFIDIRCNTFNIASVKGSELATGFRIDRSSSGSPTIDNYRDKLDVDINGGEATRKGNTFALLAWILGAASIVLVLLNKRQTVQSAAITSVLAVFMLVATFIDVKRKARLEVPGLDKSGDSRTAGATISVDFTGWFYLAVILFALGAWLCYERMRKWTPERSG